jgi:Methyltransferase domain
VTRSLDTIDIGCVVGEEGLFDFLILYESLVESWTCFPFLLHAFVVDERVLRPLERAEANRVRIHAVPQAARGALQSEAPELALVEHSGLDRCIVSAATNVFLTELPELWFLLDAHARVYVGAGGETNPLPHLWAFRRGEASSESPAVKFLATPGLNPYAIEADRVGQPLLRDPLGFLEERSGQVKVLHFPHLEGQGTGSVAERVDLVIDRFPGVATFVDVYALLAKRAAARIGLPAPPSVRIYTRDRLMAAGHIPMRDSLPFLLNQRGLKGVGVEVGVKRGRFSETILRGWRGRKLISVDAWLEAPADEYMDVGNAPQEEHEQFYRETIERLARFGDRSEVWRTTSVEAAARMERGSLDFVYIDARHDYDSVKEDLDAWFDKLRPGGVIAGHDYVDGDFGLGVFGVKSAVDEFFGERGLTVRQTYVEDARPGMPPPGERMRGGKLPSWLVELPTG